MNKENLVVLKGNINLTYYGEKIKANHFLRCVENENNTFIINGLCIKKAYFKRNFELAYDRVLRDFKSIGILNEFNLPISKSLFTNLADIHTYGNGRNSLKIWYFRNEKLIYGFYPSKGNKIENQNECYQWYMDIINGDVSPLDDIDVCFGNCGIPLMYSKLRIS